MAAASSAPVPSVTDAVTASELLEGARRGSLEVLGALASHPLLVIDLDGGGAISWKVPPLLPAVVVGVSASGRPAGGRSSRAANEFDVALAGASGQPRPWVSVPDLGPELARLEAGVSSSPVASVVLAQVLRAGRADSLDRDLALESLAYSALQGGHEHAAWLARRPTPSSRTPSAAPPVLVERRGGEVVITLNRPEVRNAFSTAMRDSLCEALSSLCADGSVERVHLRGAGASFCSGGDLSEFGTLPDAATAHLVRTGRSAARLMGLVSDRMTAHLNGECVGAGIELAALAGRVVAATGARVQLPELAMGLIPGAGGTASITRRIGRHRMAWMALSGRWVDAGTALSWGLVDEVAGTPVR